MIHSFAELLLNAVTQMKKFLLSYWKAAVEGANLNNEERVAVYSVEEEDFLDLKDTAYRVMKKEAIQKLTNLITDGKEMISILGFFCLHRFPCDFFHRCKFESAGHAAEEPLKIPKMSSQDAMAKATYLLAAHGTKAGKCEEMNFKCEKCQAWHHCVPLWPKEVPHMLPSRMLQSRGDYGRQSYNNVVHSMQPVLRQMFQSKTVVAPPPDSIRETSTAAVANAGRVSAAEIESLGITNPGATNLDQGSDQPQQIATNDTMGVTIDIDADPSTAVAPSANGEMNHDSIIPLAGDIERAPEHLELLAEGNVQVLQQSNAAITSVDPHIAQVASVAPVFDTSQLLAQRFANARADADRRVQHSMGQAARSQRSHEQLVPRLETDAAAGLPGLLAEADVPQEVQPIVTVQEELAAGLEIEAPRVTSGVASQGRGRGTGQAKRGRGRPPGSRNAVSNAQQSTVDEQEVRGLGTSARGRSRKASQRALDGDLSLVEDKPSKAQKSNSGTDAEVAGIDGGDDPLISGDMAGTEHQS